MFSPRLVKFPLVLDSLIQFKEAHRVRYSKFRLLKIYTEIEDKCNCCLSSGCHLSYNLIVLIFGLAILKQCLL